MPSLVNLHKVSKSFGNRDLFKSLSFSVEENERIGLLGPNGSGKSTLLKIMSGEINPDSGEVSTSKSANIAYVSQQDEFDDSKSIKDNFISDLKNWGMEKDHAEVQSSIYLSMAGFKDHNAPTSKLSGGWKKRLNLSIGFAKEADLLLLDEPTNHLDWDGIFWLEGFLRGVRSSVVIISHDRRFLENQSKTFTEINPIFEDGVFSANGSYSNFIDKKQDYLKTQMQLQDVLSNKARREVEWLRAGVKARTTKSKSRAKEAYELLDRLDSVQSRNRLADKKVKIDIEEGGRKAKEFIKISDVNIGYADSSVLVNNLNIIMGPKKNIGILGSNGSGKTSLLKTISNELKPLKGSIETLEDLSILFFDQKKEDLPEEKTIMTYLGDDTEHVIFKGKSIHVASYASFFLFDKNRINLPIKRLSGGEKARLLIAKLLLSTADIIILDEPTNDLDIETIEILEESLSNFGGLVLLVSHDREFLSNSCSEFLSLDGNGAWSIYSDLNQWLSHNKAVQKEEPKQTSKPKEKKKSLKLSYKETEFLKTVEEEIFAMESKIENLNTEIQTPEISSDHQKLQPLLDEIETLQKSVNSLYEEWERIEHKKKEFEESKK